MPVMAVGQLLSSNNEEVDRQQQQQQQVNLPKILLASDKMRMSSPIVSPHNPRKRSHMASEQKRRQQINEGFETLKRLVPACHHTSNADSKATILQKTIIYIEQLQKELGKQPPSPIRLRTTEPTPLDGKVRIQPKPPSAADASQVLSLLAQCAVESSPQL